MMTGGKEILNTVARIRMVFFILLCCGIIVAIRLFFLQIVSGPYYKTQASRQQNFSELLTPRRGEIYLRERSGELVPLATTKEGYLLYITPKTITDAESLYAKLKPILADSLDYEDYIARALKKDDPYEVILHKLDRRTVQKIQELKIDETGISPEEWRIYPAKTMASNVVGFLGYHEDVLEGRYGIEKYYEDVLRGKTGYVEGSRSAGGILINLGKSLFSPPEEGYDIVLTLEPNVQSFLEKKLSEVQKSWNPVRGGGIIIEPKTGKIIAMASFPNFDPNSYGKINNLQTFVNPLVENIFELGSIFKPLTMAAGLNENIITPETTYIDRGFLILDGYKVKNHDEVAMGETTMQKVLEESLNTGAAFVADKLGNDRMKKYFASYGLGEKTNITLPGEVSGNLSSISTKRKVEFATASFGQGIAVTPIEFVRAASALANGGKLMEPYIVERVTRPGREDIITMPKEIREVIRPETSEKISRMLVKVADDALLGGTIKFKNWTMAAKTGTAQLPLKNAKGYSDQYLHSFFGYAPGFDSRFLVFFFMENPRGVSFASQSFGKPFQETMQFLLTYYEVPPDR